MTISKQILQYLSVFVLITLLSCNEVVEKKCEIPYGGTFGDTRPGFLVTNFDPRTMNNADLNDTFFANYECLTTLNVNTLKPAPLIAKSWTSNNACTFYTFTIRKNIYFNSMQDTAFNNKMIDAYTIKKCYDHLTDTFKGNYVYEGLKTIIEGCEESYKNKKNGKEDKGISGINVVNDSTITFTLLKPFCDFPAMLSGIHFGIYPEEILLPSGRFPDSLLVGTGPFLISYWDDTSFQFSKNKNYWRTDSNGCQLPFLDSIYFMHNESIKGSFSNRMNMLLEDKIDIIREVNPKYIKELVNMSGFNPDQYFSTPMYGNTSIGFNTSKPPFNNPLLRKAIAYAFNKELFIDSLYQGENWYADYGFFPTSSSAKDSIFSLKYNPELAREYLAEYKKQTNQDKVIIKALAVGKEAWFPTQFKYFLERELDLTVDFQLVESIQDYYQHIFRGDYQFCNIGINLTFPNNGGYLATYHSNNLSDDPSEEVYSNIFRYSNKLFDHYLDEATTENDIDQKRKLLISAEQFLIDEAVQVPIYYTEDSYYISPLLKNYPINNLDRIDYATLYKEKPIIKDTLHSNVKQSN